MEGTDMKYIYYPGCSASGTGRGYEESTLPVFEELGIEMVTLEDWNCCGATAYMSVDEAKAFALSARNLALAEDQFPDMDEVHIVAPCAACYLGLLKAKKYIDTDPKIGGTIRKALQSAELDYTGRAKVRHPLDVLVNDYGLDKLKEKVKRPLTGLKVAAYYGCQIVRPYSDFDEGHDPQTMDQVLEVLGVEAIEWPHKTRCCGGAQTWSSDPFLELVWIILKDAIGSGGDAVATACPMCQFNLECFQNKIRAKFDYQKKIPVVYFTQLMGLALGIDANKLGMNRLFERLELPASV